MKIISQTDEEIPTHIVTAVDKDAALAEESLAQRRKVGQGRRGRRGKQASYTDLGLTANVDETTEAPILDNDDSQSLLHRKVERSSARDTEEDLYDDDHDKENQDFSGRDMFNFSAARGKSGGNMMKMAVSSLTEGEPSQRLSRKASTKRAVKPATDHAKRRRLQRQVELLRDDRRSDDDDDEQNEPGEEENSSSDEAQINKPATETEGYERYFQDLHGNAKTSNNTLSKLAVLDPQEFNDILASAPKKHVDDVMTLFEVHQQHFPQWYFELLSGFNLVFYGYGSKRNLLNHFAQTALTDGPVVVVNGYFPSITIKDIISKIAVALDLPPLSGPVQDQASVICDYFASDDRVYDRLYMVVHNVDGANLRNERCQAALSMLARASNIHLVASVDHINAGLLWDNVKTSRFNWVWHDATTFDDYLAETSFENSLLMRTGELGGARGAQYVLQSLTQNARGVFRVLAEQQLLEMEMANTETRGNETVGLPYQRYYTLCREGFHISSDLGLRSQLTEFRDHKIIASKRLLDGTEVFYIPLDKSTLLGIVENMA